MVKDSGQQYFVQHLESQEPEMTGESRAQAAFVLAVICDGHPRGQLLCAHAQLLPVATQQLRAARVAAETADPERPAAVLLLKWLCLCIGKLCEDMPEVRPASSKVSSPSFSCDLYEIPPATAIAYEPPAAVHTSHPRNVPDRAVELESLEHCLHSRRGRGGGGVGGEKGWMQRACSSDEGLEGYCRSYQGFE